ncbi:hypothetical protein ACIRFH_24070 [Streptomyces sp. NPDC093586]|uniref:hypothetical protein n=1 Tax=Streptomyces sp. NPDC093586 TaxID=3366042 RepID=UPI00382D697E
MTRERRGRVRELRRNSPLDPGGDPDVQRPLFEQALSAQPVSADAIVEKLDLAGAAALSVTVGGAPQPVDTALRPCGRGGAGYRGKRDRRRRG